MLKTRSKSTNEAKISQLKWLFSNLLDEAAPTMLIYGTGLHNRLHPSILIPGFPRRICLYILVTSRTAVRRQRVHGIERCPYLNVLDAPKAMRHISRSAIPVMIFL